MGLQLFERIGTRGQQFRIHSNTMFHTKSFCLMPSFVFLTVLSNMPQPAIENTAISVSMDDLGYFNQFTTHHNGLKEAMKEFKRRQKDDNEVMSEKQAFQAVYRRFLVLVVL
jgi:hypothetical protein